MQSFNALILKDLKVGDVLTFWVREVQFGISPTLTNQPIKIVKPDAMTNWCARKDGEENWEGVCRMTPRRLPFASP